MFLWVLEVLRVLVTFWVFGAFIFNFVFMLFLVFDYFVVFNVGIYDFYGF